MFWVKGAKVPFEVLKGVSLALRSGEMLSVVGPSGSGKSTLLRCLAGLEPLTDGHVALLDANLARASRSEIAELLREPVGVLLATPLLVPSLTVRQNVELPGLLAARSGWSTKQLALATLQELG
ncbi:MAG: ATP-binding cassette domain-containing protein, partial [Micrococcales bacterium]|nr:ATP-binding cassette domain-containing protein [Micrococcales bacterium]